MFAAAIVHSDRVPQRLRHMLNVESGLNDGLALPAVVGLLALWGSDASTLGLAWKVVLGVLIGIAIPWGAHRLTRSKRVRSE